MPAENCTGSTTQRLFECDWHRGVSRMVGSVLKRLKGPSSSCALKAKGPFAKIQCSWKLEGGGVFIHPQVVISSSVGFVWKSWNKIQNISVSAVQLNKPYAALAPYYKAYTAVYISSINHQQLPSVSNEFNTKREKSSIHQENMLVSYTAYIFDKLNHIYR